MEKKLDNYEILRSIGKGGMGEVFLARDLICSREVALKQMREEWIESKTMRERFMREARLAAQLTHPNIVSIYSIDESGNYYTMPHIEGETLKEILQLTREQAKNGEPLHPIGSSVPSLIRIFLGVCSAIAYAHDRGVLHRDLKPENIIVGKYGEVIILDWGLADFIGVAEGDAPEVIDESGDLTKPGKIPGTLLYMAPERAFGARSSPSTDIYSLGVVLYQILTLRHPFHRSSMKEFRKNHEREELIDPEEVAPDREISPLLSNIVKKCLVKTPKERYSDVEDLMKDLENYIEGMPEWAFMEMLSINDKDVWQFQENITLTKHMALTRGIEMLEWVNLMLSRAAYPGSIAIEAEFTFQKESRGFGILFCVPEMHFQKGIEQAYCLWVAPEELVLTRATVHVFSLKHPELEIGSLYSLRIQKVENHIRIYLDGTLKCSFLSHIPLSGAHIGLIQRDANFALSPLRFYSGSQNIMVNCLAVPDAFLSRNEYAEAIVEYRKIAHSFPGRSEGREATFRAGLAILRKGQSTKGKALREELYAKAHDEFEKLHHTPGEPLEYLGKSFIYKEQGDDEEEVKCLELALRKFPKHPLKPVLVETILSRLFETSQGQRGAAFRYALLTLKHLSYLPDVHKITELLERYLERQVFFAPVDNIEQALTVELAFWLKRPMVLVEMLEKDLPANEIRNAKVALLLMGHSDQADTSIFHLPMPENINAHFEYLLLNNENPMNAFEHLSESQLSQVHPRYLWAALSTSNWELADEIVAKTPTDLREECDQSFFFVYGCYLAKTQGEEEARAHLMQASESAFPPLASLLSHYLMGRIDPSGPWKKQAFFWEKVRLFQEMELYAHCLGDTKAKRLAKERRTKLVI